MVPYVAMKKTSLYLDPEVDRSLDRQAAMEGLSKAELIRRILDDAVHAGRPKPPFGVIEGGPTDVSQRVDEYLAETGFGED